MRIVSSVVPAILTSPFWALSRCIPIGGHEAAIERSLRPVQFLVCLQAGEDSSPQLLPDAQVLPLLQASPTGGRGALLARDILPPRSAAQHPQDTLQGLAVVRPRAQRWRRSCCFHSSTAARSRQCWLVSPG
jgi:hypothetical protein